MKPAYPNAVHGIRDEDVAGKARLAQMAPALAALLDGCNFCGFNILHYHLKFLLVEFRRTGPDLPTEDRHVVDALTIYHRMGAPGPILFISV